MFFIFGNPVLNVYPASKWPPSIVIFVIQVVVDQEPNFTFSYFMYRDISYKWNNIFWTYCTLKLYFGTMLVYKYNG